MELVPHFWRSNRAVAVYGVIAFAAVTLWDTTQDRGQDLEVLGITLGFLFVFAPLFVWFTSVPRKLAFTETHFTIQTRFGALHEAPWAELENWGTGQMANWYFEFSFRPTFAVFRYAFRPEDWKQLADFIRDRFPEREAKIWIGSNGFRRHRKK